MIGMSLLESHGQKSRAVESGSATKSLIRRQAMQQNGEHWCAVSDESGVPAYELFEKHLGIVHDTLDSWRSNLCQRHARASGFQNCSRLHAARG